MVKVSAEEAMTHVSLTTTLSAFRNIRGDARKLIPGMTSLRVVAVEFSFLQRGRGINFGTISCTHQLFVVMPGYMLLPSMYKSK